MGNSAGKYDLDLESLEGKLGEGLGRFQAVIGAKGHGEGKKGSGRSPDAQEADFLQNSLANLLLFNKLEPRIRNKIVGEMYEKSVPAGSILIQEGATGQAASQLYVVKTGKFEVLERRKGVNMRVNVKEPGDVFGEISLMYNCPRTATVAATTDAVVFVLERDVFRHYIQAAAESNIGEVELFLNSVPLLSPLSRQDKMRLVDAFENVLYPAGSLVIKEGEEGDKFYIIKGGEAVVLQGGKEVNRLFRADFFGEHALLNNEPRNATVKAVADLDILVLSRDTFVEILGPLEKIMQEAKSEVAVAQRMAKLKPRGSGVRAPTTSVILKVNNAQRGSVEVEAVAKLDEVRELYKGGQTLAQEAVESQPEGSPRPRLVLIERELLGEGAFSRVSQVVEDTTQRAFALKRMNKAAALQCPDHVYCEQVISKNTASPFCIRQYATFKDSHHLYFLFDLMPGGDLMDVLVAEAKIVKHSIGGKGSFRQAKMWQGMEEKLAKFYVASIVLALEYLHDNGVVYRDLKPENVLIDGMGWAKLGDFGFAKHLGEAGRTYTFCGTPGYVAPENVLGRGYNHSVDYWTLGVLMYVLLTARQPFSSPKTQDPMEVMRRIVDDRWPVKYPPYMSDAAQDLIARLLERKPAKRLGMLQGKVNDIKRHEWFRDFDWEALAAARMEPPRKPKSSDTAKRKQELSDAHRMDPVAPMISPEELKEADQVFAEF